MNIAQFSKLMYTIFKQDPIDIGYIEKQGLLAVKIGQTFALRIDFLDVERCNALSKLYDATTIIPAEDAKIAITTALSPAAANAFSSIDYTPLASASVGQVHPATLKDGSDVVIKFIKHDFAEQFEKDVRSVKRLMRFAITFYPTLARVADPIGILDHIEQYTVKELNLQHEYEGQQLLKKIHEENTSKYDLSLLRFPHVYPEYSNERVLVSERLHGETFDQLLDRGALSYDQLLQLFHLHGFYLFAQGTFHGDLHPGNIIYQDDHIYFIDTGAISTVSDRIRTGLFFFFSALSRYDYEECAHFLNQMAQTRISGKAFETFRDQFIELYKDFTNSTVSQVSLTQKMMQTIKLGVRSGMQFDRGMFPIIKSMMYLDGMVLRCNPNAKLLEDMRPFVEEMQRTHPLTPLE